MMFRATPQVVAALSCYGEVPLGKDLTDQLLQLAAREAELPEVLLAATVRAACSRIAAAHRGNNIELRVPPYAAVQVGFGLGSKHTRGTPPNVVELTGREFVDLVVGRSNFDSYLSRCSGAHSRQLAQVFPLTWC